MGSAMKANQSTAAGGPSGAATAGAPGLGRSGLGASGGQRLPTPPRERKPALAALAVLLILGGALASAYLVTASGDRVSAIQIAQPVAAGQRIPPGALREVPIGDTGIEYLSWSEAAAVTKHYATVPLVEGTLLTNAMISPTNDAASGRLVVGLALKPGQVPVGGVVEGKHVTVYAVGGEEGGGPRPGTVLAADAIVVGVGQGGGSTVAGERLGSGMTTVDVAVPPGEAADVAGAASAGAVAIALIPPGTEAGSGGASPPPADGTRGGAPARGGPGQGAPTQGTAPSQGAPTQGGQPSGGAGTPGAPGTGTGGN
ncbi:hypothetical protein [Actinomadura rifamycini]|uniref:hypothetical protein n=1 Tax=Actinomadura rifamycini TaxID=31962 RepID=UPI000423DBFE|nr:hypothetical protein [Actinomadura rifamycini]